jgi:putative transposase
MHENKVKDKGSKAQVKSINAVFPEVEKFNVMDLLQFGGSMLLKQAITDEITRYLGRDFYKHLKTGDAFKGERNGYRTTRLDTPVGRVEYERPLVSYAPDFKSNFHVPYMRRPKQFADSVCDMHVNGVSYRNVKKALKSIAGKKIQLSKSSVSRITKRMNEEFNKWKVRDLSHLKVAYIIFDAIRIPMRLGGQNLDSVMVAYGVLENGNIETISIATRNGESNACWESFIADLIRRGLQEPLLAVSDGNQPLINMIEKYLPTSWRQRCVRHKTENILETVPKEKHQEVRADINKIFYGSTSLEQAKIAAEDFKKKYNKVFPSAVECLERDLSQCLTYYQFPYSHWQRIRTSNQLERVNLEIRRRINAIGRHPSEEGCLSLIYYVATRYTENISRKFGVDDLVRNLWLKLKEHKKEMIKQLEFDLKVA